MASPLSRETLCAAAHMSTPPLFAGRAPAPYPLKAEACKVHLLLRRDSAARMHEPSVLDRFQSVIIANGPRPMLLMANYQHNRFGLAIRMCACCRRLRVVISLMILPVSKLHQRLFCWTTCRFDVSALRRWFRRSDATTSIIEQGLPLLISFGDSFDSRFSDELPNTRFSLQ